MQPLQGSREASLSAPVTAKVKQQLRLSQSLVMTSQLQQAIAAGDLESNITLVATAVIRASLAWAILCPHPLTKRPRPT